MTATTIEAPTWSINRLAGAVLALTAFLTLVAVLHHPMLHGPKNMNIVEIARGLQAAAGMDRLIHGSLIGILSLQLVSLYVFSVGLGLRRPVIAAGFMAYAAGVVFMVIPSMLDGFVTPDLATACIARLHGCDATDVSVFTLVAVMIQNFTKVALVAMAMGIFCWSVALLLGRDWIDRASGILGIPLAATPLIIFMSSNIHLGPENLAGIIASQVTWNLLVAIHLIRKASDLGKIR